MGSYLAVTSVHYCSSGFHPVRFLEEQLSEDLSAQCCCKGVSIMTGEMNISSGCSANEAWAGESEDLLVANAISEIVRQHRLVTRGPY